MLYLNLTFMLLFANIALLMGVPTEFIGDNPLTNNNIFFDSITTQGETHYQVNQDIQTKVDALSDADNEPNLLDSILGILDNLKIVWDFIRTLVLIFGFSVLMVVQLNTINPFIGLILGIPLVLAYAIALFGWIRSGN